MSIYSVWTHNNWFTCIYSIWAYLDNTKLFSFFYSCGQWKYAYAERNIVDMRLVFLFNLSNQLRHIDFLLMFTYTIPLPHLSQTGNFCRFPVGGVGLIVGAFTVLVTIGREPVHTEERPFNKTTQKKPCTCKWLKHINRIKTTRDMRHEGHLEPLES